VEGKRTSRLAACRRWRSQQSRVPGQRGYRLQPQKALPLRAPRLANTRSNSEFGRDYAERGLKTILE
jgi:hypothetical protein